jgi:exoribonuclease-2
MILANCHWGGFIAECGVPGIYRSQASMAPGVKVRMGTKPAPHAGMGVPQYTWATSPLRRYVDLVNQWQIIAATRHGRTAALVAPFKPRDAALFAVISGFEAAYSAYNGFQNAIERYWTLRWLQQNEVTEFEAHVMKDGLVRATELPLVLRVGGSESLPRGALVRLRLTGVDLLTLDAYANLLARVDEPVTADDQALVDDSADDEEAPATGLALAIEVDETESSSATAPADAAPATAPL